MASDDRPNLPRATLQGENLYVEGEKEPYFRDSDHTIWLRVDALTIYRGYELEDYAKRAGKVFAESLRGIAKLEGRDRFAVAGRDMDPKTSIEFYLKPVSDTETKFHWYANIGFQTRDWEFDLREGFWIQGYCTRQYFDDLLAAVRRGHVHNIRVGMETSMWTRDNPFGISPRTWHVAPSTNGQSAGTEWERGNISSLTWEEKFGLHLAEDTGEEKPQVVELPARVYSMLTALIAMIAALLVLTFLRH